MRKEMVPMGGEGGALKNCGQKGLGAMCSSTKIPLPLAPVLSVVHGLQNTVCHECASHYPVKRVGPDKGLFGGFCPLGSRRSHGSPFWGGGRGLSGPRPLQMNFFLKPRGAISPPIPAIFPGEIIRVQPPPPPIVRVLIWPILLLLLVLSDRYRSVSWVHGSWPTAAYGRG